MKMIDVTNSHSRLVAQQLENTDAQFVRVYSLGQTTVFFTRAAAHIEILLINKQRNVKSTELDFTLDYLRKHHDLTFNKEDVDVLQLKGAVELSVKLHPVG